MDFSAVGCVIKIYRLFSHRTISCTRIPPRRFKQRWHWRMPSCCFFFFFFLCSLARRAAGACMKTSAEAQHQRGGGGGGEAGLKWCCCVLVVNTPPNMQNTDCHTHTHTHMHSLSNHLPFRRACVYPRYTRRRLPLSSSSPSPPLPVWMAATCFTLWQQMVQPPLHYSPSLSASSSISAGVLCTPDSWLRRFPVFSLQCLCLSSCLSLFLPHPSSPCLPASLSATSVCLCVCVCLWLAEGCLCYV